jgi:hypothetical protein
VLGRSATSNKKKDLLLMQLCSVCRSLDLIIQNTCGASQLPSAFFVWIGEENFFCGEDNKTDVIVIVLIIIFMFHLNDFLFRSTYPA